MTMQRRDVLKSLGGGAAALAMPGLALSHFFFIYMGLI